VVTSTGSALALLGLYLLSCHFVRAVRDRNFIRTSDGSIAHARDEFRFAAMVGARSGPIVGQQYGPPTEDEEHTSFQRAPLKRAISSADQ
jgi:hypothetical protein